MQRYDAIMNGDEKLDTPQKLKDFWLFAVEQGWKDYEMREHVALLTEEIDWKSPLTKHFFALLNHPTPHPLSRYTAVSETLKRWTYHLIRTR